MIEHDAEATAGRPGLEHMPPADLDIPDIYLAHPFRGSRGLVTPLSVLSPKFVWDDREASL